MAHRHVSSLLLPSSSAITRLVCPSAGPSSFASARIRYPRPVQACTIHHCSKIRFRHASGAASTESVKRDERAPKEDDTEIWNLPPPASSPESEGERGLPVPDNVDVTSALASGHAPRTSSEDSDATTTNDHPREATLPNYPTLPSTEASASSSPAPKLGTPNMSSSASTSPSLDSSSDTETSTQPSSPKASGSRPYDLSLLTSKLSQASKNLTIPPEVQARIAEWSTAMFTHSKRVAKDTERRLVELGLKVNQMTGYQEVERLKGLVFSKEDNLQSLREAARSAKTAYDEAVASRSSAQRDVNSLLERKHSWTDSDVVKFTSLVRADHSSTHAVASTSVALKEAELAVDKAFSELMQTILQRYHEEQVWSDKIRSVSTWANLMGLALNAFIFLGAVVFVEPWKRRRLVERLEERVAGMMERVEGRLGGMEGYLKELPMGQMATAGASAADVAAPTTAVIDRLGEHTSPHSVSALDEVIPPLEAPPVEPSSTSFETSLPKADERIPATIATTSELAPAPLFQPLVSTQIHGLPEYLDAVAHPSQERDMALAGLAGAAIMGCLMTIGRWTLS